MKKKQWVLQLVYYFLIGLLFIGFQYVTVGLLERTSPSLGLIEAYIYAMLFVGIPVFAAVLMRFSLLKWYVDPFAAAVIPVCYHMEMVMKTMEKTPGFFAAWGETTMSLFGENRNLGLFLVGLFALGLLASFSPARKRGESIAYKLLGK